MKCEQMGSCERISAILDQELAGDVQYARMIKAACQECGFNDGGNYIQIPKEIQDLILNATSGYNDEYVKKGAKGNLIKERDKAQRIVDYINIVLNEIEENVR